MHAQAAQLAEPEKSISIQELLDRGYNITEIAAATGFSRKTIQNIIRDTNTEKTLLEEYRSVQPLQFVNIQARLLSAITDEKIMDAPLRDIVGAFKVLKDKELVMDGKPTEIHGLVGYLAILEKEERGEIDVTPMEETSNFDVVPGFGEMPCL